ncbi:hypothetical protein [Nannocystis punicea]|uniref:Uncharacterized protein n=1 Tax=Nannocystis punicea TaxID=2995304 RepID=A0ABY7HBJ1_9BACT|nr:hypothetical protein [Nannocystis poenicansa]WAS96644.1 hypothetical protein O0S08_10860 [Nannocystis poenicansa]
MQNRSLKCIETGFLAGAFAFAFAFVASLGSVQARPQVQDSLSADAEAAQEADDPPCMKYLTLPTCHATPYNCTICSIGGTTGLAEDDGEGDGAAPPVPRYLPQAFGF